MNGWAVFTLRAVQRSVLCHVIRRNTLGSNRYKNPLRFVNVFGVVPSQFDIFVPHTYNDATKNTGYSYPGKFIRALHSSTLMKPLSTSVQTLQEHCT